MKYIAVLNLIEEEKNESLLDLEIRWEKKNKQIHLNKKKYNKRINNYNSTKKSIFKLIYFRFFKLLISL